MTNDEQGQSTESITALKNALTWFKVYHAGNDLAFADYMKAFDRACGLTGWTDAAVLEWLKDAAK
jgi:hypothetical protein